MFGGARPLRVEERWVRFERGRVLHRVEVTIYVEGPRGVSFTKGVGACGKHGQPEIKKTSVARPHCPRCEEKTA
jgi:hypothetical protein